MKSLTSFNKEISGTKFKYFFQNINKGLADPLYWFHTKMSEIWPKFWAQHEVAGSG